MSDEHNTHGNDGHERSDFSLKLAALTVAGLAALTLAGMGVSWWLFEGFEERSVATEPAPPPLIGARSTQPPEPRLQVSPRADIDELRRAENEMLSSYGWVDKDAGLVRVPIEQAMEMVLKKGLPAREEVGKEKLAIDN